MAKGAVTPGDPGAGGGRTKVPAEDRSTFPPVSPTALTDSAAVAIYYYAGPGLPLYTNPAFKIMFGVGAAENIDVWAETIHPLDRERIRSEWTRFERQLDSGVDQFETQYRAFGSDGKAHVMLERLVRGVGVPGFVGTITDVTELVQTQTELERAHKALVAASHRAGRAEVATSVLHNVGNVLNSVNVSASVLETRLNGLRIEGLKRVSEMLIDQGDALASFMTTGKGKRLPAYLAQLAAQLAEDQAASLQELHSLADSLEHIKHIVRMQQNYATETGIQEVLSVEELIQDSVRMNAAGFVRHGVRLELDIGQVAPVKAQKHKVLQILINLLSNAKYACDGAGGADKHVTIRVRPSAAGVSISVIDNGMGIRAQDMEHIFAYGFTTRAEGHGFGLHSAAIAAMEMKGALHASSEGIGRGATFTLELPAEAAENGG